MPRIWCLGTLAMAALLVPASADAAFPGRNGRILFSQNTAGGPDLKTVNPNGTNEQTLLVGDESGARFSPDASRIAYSTNDNDEIGVQIKVAPVVNPGGGAVLCNCAGTPEWTGTNRVLYYDGGLRLSGPNGAAGGTLVDADSTYGVGSIDGRIAYEKAGQIYVADKNGNNGHPIVTGSSPQWMPDGKRILYDSSGSRSIVNADGSNAHPSGIRDGLISPDGKKVTYSAEPGTQDVHVANIDGSADHVIAHGFNPSWEPRVEPIIFIHGFLGSKIDCGGEAWPNLFSPRLDAMALGNDGVSSPCNVHDPGEDGLIKRAGSDVYGSTVDFLARIAPGRYHVYSWDWRKSPELALADLDKLIDKVRSGSKGKVVLYAHSMGGLVTRWYIHNPKRAKKVARAVTVGTPYWGAPKAFFPLAAGVEGPGFSFLDVLLNNAALQRLAQNLTGLYFLWPSQQRFGDWLTVDGRMPAPLDLQGVAQFVDSVHGNSTLLLRARAAHNGVLDHIPAGALNGVDYQLVVGTGLNTLTAVRVKPLPNGEAYYYPTWDRGDRTVPYLSARAGLPGGGKLHFACYVDHLKLPGHKDVTGRIGDFLAAGEPITGAECNRPNLGYGVNVFKGTLGPVSPKLHAAAAGSALTLDQAQRQGLIERLDLPLQDVFATDDARPVKLKLGSRPAALVIRRLADGKQGKPVYYEPVAGGVLKTSGKKLVLRRGGKVVRPRKKPDRKPPRTRVKVKVDGKKAILRFTAKDASGVSATYVKVGKKGRRVRGKVTIGKGKLRKVRFQSVDVFGNIEKPRRVPKHT
jgi:pimeloyl-ACP methyl ester carboxylesterase